SNPEMNWRLSQLDSFSIVSNSDCHSPSKIGREATVFEIEPNFASLRGALKNPKKGEEILYTIEFYPEEGKYHYSGHRNCNYVQSPKDAGRDGTTCPVCKKTLTVGVMHRVEELADKPYGYVSKKRPPYKSLVPLLEIVAESVGIVSITSKKVNDAYLAVLKKFGTEFSVLLDEPLLNIKQYDAHLSDGIKRMREGKINIKPGYDGVFGKVKIWKE
ncbi:DNA helicase UvrD, partial [bacterium]|nr:DNA helicase UvrD [bacterium]